MPIRSARMPKVTPMPRSKDMISAFSLACLFILKRTRIPTPAPAKSPDIIAPADTTPDIASLVKATEDAQLGTSPTIAQITWLITGIERTDDESASSPIKKIAEFISTDRKSVV